MRDFDYAELAGVMFMEPRESFDRCIVGFAERFNATFAIYSRSCVLGVIAGDMPTDDPAYPADIAALEFYNFNVLGSWVDSGTPAFMLDADESGL